MKAAVFSTVSQVGCVITLGGYITQNLSETILQYGQSFVFMLLQSD